MNSFDPKTPSKCPPKDADSLEDTFFRVVFHNPPIPDDFRIWVLEPENEHELDDRRRKNDCRAFAISMLSESGIARTSKLFWRGMRKKAEARRAKFLGIAAVYVNSDSGVLKQTGKNPDHFDLWPFTSCHLEKQVVSIKGI